MNSFKTTWMRLNSTRFIDLKMKLNFNIIRILHLCNDFPFMMNYRKDLKYCIINIKVDKTCHEADYTIKKDYSLNKIWLKLCQESSKLNFVLTIFKTHKNKIVLFVSHFSKMFIYVKRVSRYFIVFPMFIILQFEAFSRELFSV